MGVTRGTEYCGNSVDCLAEFCRSLRSLMVQDLNVELWPIFNRMGEQLAGTSWKMSLHACDMLPDSNSENKTKEKN